MRKVYLLMLAFLIFGLTAFPQEMKVNVATTQLSDYDGLKTIIRGPFGTPMQEEFFTKDLDFLVENELNYYTELTISANEFDDPCFFLVNPLGNGRPYPVVISIIREDGSFKNYIAVFGKESELFISIGEELDNLNGRKNLNSQSPRFPLFAVMLISGKPFDAYVYDNHRLKYELDVIVPAAEYQESSRQSAFELCVCTTCFVNPTPPCFMDIYIVPDGSEDRYYGFMIVSAVGPYGSPYPLVRKYKHYLWVDYPAKGNYFYVPHDEYETTSLWKWQPLGEEYCFQEMGFLYTDFYNKDDDYRTTFLWFTMCNVIYDISGGSSRVRGIDGYWSGYWYTIYNDE